MGHCITERIKNGKENKSPSNNQKAEIAKKSKYNLPGTTTKMAHLKISCPVIKL